MKLPTRLFLLVLCFAIATFAAAGQIGVVDRDFEFKPTLVVLGTYHMGTPGNNVVNGKVDDVSTPARQGQMVKLVERLAKFSPTKIAVECDVKDDAKTQETYNRYVLGTYQLSKDETDQIGFRLAKKLGLKKVNCIDWGIFPNDPSYNYEKYAAENVDMDGFLKDVYGRLKKDVDAEHEQLFRLSVIDQLILLNQPGRIEKDHRRYFDLMRIGQGQDYIGANYVSWWYGRNMKIFDNIIRITDSARERILVIYGAGHLKLLTQFANESGYYQVENPLKYLEHKS